MSFEFYKVMHLMGVFMTVMGLAAVVVHTLNGGTKASNSFRKGVALTHGVGLLLALVGGFGLLARLGLVQGFPGWVYIKLAIWLVFGGFLAIAYRKPKWSKTLWFTIIVFCAFATWIARTKPF